MGGGPEEGLGLLAEGEVVLGGGVAELGASKVSEEPTRWYPALVLLAAESILGGAGEARLRG
jgi:hypothetical protein